MIAKKEIIAEFQRKEGDTGSTEVQVALLTARIKALTEHLKSHKQDDHTRKGLTRLVSKRRSLLNYLQRTNLESYRALRTKLGI